MLEKCKELLTRNGLEKYIEWLVNYLCRNEAENIKGYITNDVMWYFYNNTGKGDISRIDRLPMLYSLINKYSLESPNKSWCYCLKYKGKLFYIGNCGNNICFSILVDFVSSNVDVIDCEKIIASIEK